MNQRTEDLTEDQVQGIKESLWAEDMQTEMEAADDRVKLVAEGDSWFDYPPSLDLLDNLKRDYKYKIYKLAEAGDTLENLVYGTEYRRSDFGRKPPQILLALRAIEKYKPKAVLFSGGGNDVAGDEFASYLNHYDGIPASPLRPEVVDYMFGEVFPRMLDHFLNKVWQVAPNLPVVAHGYGYARPTGRAVINLPFGFRFIGPWLRPALAMKNISPAMGRVLIEKLIDRYNAILEGLDAENAHFHHVDFRDLISDDDWKDELHLRSGAYQRCAERLHGVLNSL